MSRAKHSESLHEVQLFPFVAVLLCTMGALLVLLVILTRSSKDRAAIAAVAAQADARVAAAARASEIKQSNEAARRELETLGKYQAELDAARNQAAEQLRHDQLRLSHLEDHMMRIRAQLESLQLAAAELNALEGEHVDDRKLAEQEIARLERLIADSIREIDQLRAETKARSKSFAIVPYQGQHGTFRRPIYIECGPEEVVIQPEGIVFTIDDFQPPIRPGNPLAASLRAAREHIIATSAATGKAAEPYPLIIVRPAGIDAYYHVREAIQSWDSEFGYELVEQDWELKYSAADPQLAVKEQAAADLARARLRALAEAAPQAFAAYRSGGDGGRGRRGFATGGYNTGPGGTQGAGGSRGYDEDEFDYEVAELPAGGGPRLASRPGGPSVVAVQGSDAMQQGKSLGSGKVPANSSTGGDSSNGGGLSDDRYAQKSTDDRSGSMGAAADEKPASAGGGPQHLGAKQQSLEEMERQPNGAPAPGHYTAGDDAEKELDELARVAAAGEQTKLGEYRKPPKVRGKNWAIAAGRPGTIPIRRSIQIVMREDSLAILPENSPAKELSSTGQEFRFGDVPDQAFDDLISAIEQRIQNWGIAGEGLYWRPVVQLNVNRGSDRRVEALMRHLRYSGVEVEYDEIAQRVEGGTGNGSR